MELSIENIDSVIDKLNQLKSALTEVGEVAGENVYLTSKDIAEMMNVSEPSARAFMNRPDFPKLDIGKGYRVSSWALLLYTMSART